MADTVPFLVLKENRFVWTALERLKVSAAGLQSVYLYGPSGSGKSHLVRQFARDLQSNSKLSIAHVTAGQLAGESQEIRQRAARQYSAGRPSVSAAEAENAPVHAGSVTSIESWEPVSTGPASGTDNGESLWLEAADDEAFDPLQQQYRGLDVLVCEDLTELQRWPQTQAQLVPLLDEILRRGGRVVLTSNCSPGQLSGFSPRLVTRFRNGVCAAIEPLDATSRCKLIKHLASAKQIPITSDAARLVADELVVSPRELQETLVRLDQSARIQQADLDQTFVQRFLASEIKPQSLTLQQVTTAVARHYGVTVGDLRSESRLQGLALARHCAMFLCRERTGLALRTISAFFGGRKHSTVLHACRRIERLLESRPEVRRDIEQICRVLGAPSIVATR